MRYHRRRGPEPQLPWDGLAAEMERARRYERPFTLVRLALPPGPDVADLPRPPIRRTDRTWSAAGVRYVLAPETGRDDRPALVSRLRAAYGDDGALDVRAVSFPDDGITSGGLLAAMTSHPVGEPALATTGATDDERRAS